MLRSTQHGSKIFLHYVMEVSLSLVNIQVRSCVERFHDYKLLKYF